MRYTRFLLEFVAEEEKSEMRVEFWSAFVFAYAASRIIPLCSFPGLGEQTANRSGSRVVLFDFFYSPGPGSGLQDVSHKGTIPFAWP